MNPLCLIGLHKWEYKADVMTANANKYRRCKNPQCSRHAWVRYGILTTTSSRKPW